VFEVALLVMLIIATATLIKQWRDWHDENL